MDKPKQRLRCVLEPLRCVRTRGWRLRRALAAAGLCFVGLGFVGLGFVGLCFAGLGVTVAAAADSPAGATPRSDWWHEANLQVVVHEHSFYRVTINNIGCQVRVRLYLDAPFERYQAADAARNYFRFRAQLKLTGGHSFESPAFTNESGGQRVFAFTHDSSGERCWAKEPRKLRKLDVNACRGRGCGIEPFK